MSKTGSITRLSMWSGPRNISTALMRSFSSRSDCHPIDEPFYAYYLRKTGLNHPLREEVLKSQPHHWQDVATQINGPLPSEKSVLYLKHMTQHMLPEIDLSAFADHTHCFLIRDPRQVISSFSEKWDEIDLDTLGYRQQLRLYETFSKSASAPLVVVEGEDIQKSPEQMLKTLCYACGLTFEENMLHWQLGPHPEDGVWGTHWYNAVNNSIGFAPFAEKEISLTAEQEKLAAQLQPIYEELRSEKLKLKDTSC